MLICSQGERAGHAALWAYLSRHVCVDGVVVHLTAHGGKDLQPGWDGGEAGHPQHCARARTHTVPCTTYWAYADLQGMHACCMAGCTEAAGKPSAGLEPTCGDWQADNGSEAGRLRRDVWRWGWGRGVAQDQPTNRVVCSVLCTAKPPMEPLMVMVWTQRACLLSRTHSSTSQDSPTMTLTATYSRPLGSSKARPVGPLKVASPVDPSTRPPAIPKRLPAHPVQVRRSGLTR